MKTIDVDFNLCKSSKSGVPDTDSKELYDVYKMLLNKVLDSIGIFELKVKGNN